MQFTSFLLILWLGIANASSSDIDSLIEFKKGISSPHILDSWNPTNLQEYDGCPLNWNGVQCFGNRVVSITLNGMGLLGTIDFAALAKMELFRNLSLSNNHLTGNLSSDVGSITSLEFLDLSRNSFHGSIPNELTRIGNLVSLNLSSNNFEGHVPPGLGNLSKLNYLDLRDNRISGDLDGVLGQLESLIYIDLSRNQFSGSIKSIDDNSTITDSLKHLDISFNNLSGELFAQDPVPLFDSLEVFDASYNQLSGNVPSFNFIFSLRILSLGNNQFSGSLPEALLKESSMVLNELDLSCNQLTGPVKIITSTTLKTLNLSTNNLTGSLPPRVGSCSTVDLSNNMLSGDLSAVQSWGNYVEVIDLSSNRLTGTLPNETSQFLRLISLKVSNNLLAGELPLVLGTYPEINIIDFSLNQLYGSIPSTLFTSLRLIDLNLSGNSFTGLIPFPNSATSVSPNMSLVSLDLSDNSLSAELPQEIGTMSELKLLNIGRNNISGEIPKEIGLLHNLLYIDLSNNHLKGIIPNELPDGLLGFNVSYNNLSGIVPENLLKFPPSSFHPGNDQLIFPHVPPSDIPKLTNKRNRYHRMKNAVIYTLVVVVIMSMVLIIVSILIYRMAYHKAKATPEEQTPRNFFGLRKNAKKLPVPSTSFSQDHLLSSRASAPCGHGDVSCASKESKEPDITTASSSSPPIIKGNSTSLIISSPPQNFPCSSENPSVLNMCSPDRLAGDLHLFDNSTLFTAEDLSRAPAEIIGRSCHGTSYKATLPSGHVLTVKSLREGIAKSKKEFCREAKKLGTIRHPNLVSLRGYYWGRKELEKLIISDYINATSLMAHLCEFQSRDLQPLSLSQRLTIAVNIASCLNYMHTERAIPHGNLKSTNILITHSPSINPLLTDYSLHRILTPVGMADQVLNAGALGYRPPEFASTTKPCPSLKSDVYAFGVVLLEILTGKSAGEIVSGNPGVVDLTDWVKLLASENRAYECFDRVIPEVSNSNGGQPPPKVLEDILGVALRCIRSASERPEIRTVFEDLSLIEP